MTLRPLAALAAAAAALVAAAAPAQGDVYRHFPTSASINSADVTPPEVGPQRFTALTEAVAAGWGIGIDAPTFAEPGVRDGANAIGFSEALPDQVLGAYIFWARRVYRTKKVCKGRTGHRRCHRVKRYAYSSVPEADVAFNARFNWNPGPRYPRDDEIDLTTVVIHELGHFADPNAPHGPRCSGSPLTESLGFGEWWRGSDDWHEVDCDNSPSKRIGDAFPASVPVHFERIVHQLPDRVISARRG